MLQGSISFCYRKLLRLTCDKKLFTLTNCRFLSSSPVSCITRFSKHHTWVDLIRGMGPVGVTDYGQKCLGDVQSIDLPSAGKIVDKNNSICNLDCQKACVPFYPPVPGVLMNLNSHLVKHPNLINEDPLGQGWIAILSVGSPDELYELMTEEQYEEYVKNLPLPILPDMIE